MRIRVAVCVIALMMCSGCVSELWRHASVYNFQESYTDWARLDYEVRECNNGMIDCMIIFEFDKDGRACTNAWFSKGSHFDRFYYRNADFKSSTFKASGVEVFGRRSVIRMSDAGKQEKYEEFFVGTKAQFKLAGAPPWGQ